MRLELLNNGVVAIRKVTADAMDYIDREREATPDAGHRHWLFSYNYEGTVYITATPYEEKKDLLRILDMLISHYGLIVSDNVKPMIDLWRRDELYAKQTYEANARAEALEGRLKSLQHLLKVGCEGCKNFCYDGDCGRCKLDGKELNETPLSFRNGKYDRQGVLHLGSKFYPHEDCKFLNEVIV